MGQHLPLMSQYDSVGGASEFADGNGNTSQFSASPLGVLQRSPSLMTRLHNIQNKGEDLKDRLKRVKLHQQFGPPPQADVLGELIISDERGNLKQENKFEEKFNLNK